MIKTVVSVKNRHVFCRLRSFTIRWNTAVIRTLLNEWITIKNGRLRPRLIDLETLKLTNIPTDLSIHDIQRAFIQLTYCQLHIPRDPTNNHLGIIYITFDTFILSIIFWQIPIHRQIFIHNVCLKFL
jgi:hypothetical protein